MLQENILAQQLVQKLFDAVKKNDADKFHDAAIQAPKELILLSQDEDGKSILDIIIEKHDDSKNSYEKILILLQQFGLISSIEHIDSILKKVNEKGTKHNTIIVNCLTSLKDTCMKKIIEQLLSESTLNESEQFECDLIKEQENAPLTNRSFYWLVCHFLQKLESKILADTWLDSYQLIQYLNIQLANLKDVVISETGWSPDFGFPEEDLKKFLSDSHMRLFILPVIIEAHFRGFLIRKNKQGALEFEYFDPLSTSENEKKYIQMIQQEVIKLLPSYPIAITSSSIKLQFNNNDCGYIVADYLVQRAQEIPSSPQPAEKTVAYAKKIAQIRNHIFQTLLEKEKYHKDDLLKEPYLWRISQLIVSNPDFRIIMTTQIEIENTDVPNFLIHDAIKKAIHFFNHSKKIPSAEFIMDELKKQLKETKLESLKTFTDLLLQPSFPDKGNPVFIFNPNFFVYLSDPRIKQDFPELRDLKIESGEKKKDKEEEEFIFSSSFRP